jgi:hypothetical protein
MFQINFSLRKNRVLPRSEMEGNTNSNQSSDLNDKATKEMDRILRTKKEKILDKYILKNMTQKELRNLREWLRSEINFIQNVVNRRCRHYEKDYDKVHDESFHFLINEVYDCCNLDSELISDLVTLATNKNEVTWLSSWFLTASLSQFLDILETKSLYMRVRKGYS